MELVSQKNIYFSVCLVFCGFVVCFVLFFIFLSCFGKIACAELHPLSYILSTTISPISPKTSLRGRSRVVGQSGWQEVQHPASWAATPTQFTLGHFCQPKKTSWSSFLLLVTFFSHLLEPCSPRSCADHLHHLSSAHFLTEQVFLCYFCWSCVLSGSSLFPISVIRTAFKPAVFIRLKS